MYLHIQVVEDTPVIKGYYSIFNLVDYTKCSSKEFFQNTGIGFELKYFRLFKKDNNYVLEAKVLYQK